MCKMRSRELQTKFCYTLTERGLYAYVIKLNTLITLNMYVDDCYDILPFLRGFLCHTSYTADDCFVGSQ